MCLVGGLYGGWHDIDRLQAIVIRFCLPSMFCVSPKKRHNTSVLAVILVVMLVLSLFRMNFDNMLYNM